jgi:hypothetical protein
MKIVSTTNATLSGSADFDGTQIAFLGKIHLTHLCHLVSGIPQKRYNLNDIYNTFRDISDDVIFLMT